MSTRGLNAMPVRSMTNRKPSFAFCGSASRSTRPQQPIRSSCGRHKAIATSPSGSGQCDVPFEAFSDDLFSIEGLRSKINSENEFPRNG